MTMFNPSADGQLPPPTSRSGQTLIEVIIAAGLMVLVLVTLASGIAIGIRNNRVARDQARSKEYVREALEWMRNMRDSQGWDTFAAIAKEGTYCMDTLPDTATAFSAKNTGTCGGSQYIPNASPFIRTLQLTKAAGNPPPNITGIATVTWQDGSKTFSSTSTVTLYQWK